MAIASYVEVPPASYHPLVPYKGPAKREAPTSCLINKHNFQNSPINRHPSEIALDALALMDSVPYDSHLHHYSQLAKEFCDYLDLCEQKGFVVHGFDYAKTKIHNYYLEYENRWAPGRRKELSDKLDRLEYWFTQQMDRPVTMITLTSYHEGYTIQEAWDELSRSRGKLLKLIAFYFGEKIKVKDKKGKLKWKIISSPDYFWVVEPHKSGYVHFHLAVFADVSNNTKDDYGEGIEDKFRRLWSKKYKTGNHTYGLDFSQKKGDEKLRSLKKYLSKYLQKGFLLNQWTPAMLVFNSCLWETGFRMYGASKNVSHIMNIKEEKQDKIVWLQTKIKDVKKDTHEDGSEYTYDEERVVWYRQYIPDWLDSPFWLQDNANKIRIKDPDAIYIYDWGRPIRDITQGYDPTYGVITHIDKNHKV